jgi:uncharacterized RDD family membrane protein YckC
MAKLLVQESRGVREFELVDLEVGIGRELDNALRLPDPSISRHHAVIRKVPAGHEIHDLQSSNGVLLNGVKVPSGPLQDGDRITLGQMQITFLDPHPAPASLGTVRMSPEDMARFRANLGGVPAAQAAGAQEADAQAVEVQEADAQAVEVQEADAQAASAQAGGHPAAGPSPTPVVSPDALSVPERGTFQPRLQAGLIDASPMLALGGLSWILGRAFPDQAGGWLDQTLGLLRLGLLAAYLVYLPWCWMHSGATPGKRRLGLRVVPEQDPAGRLDLAGAVARLVGYAAMACLGWILVALLKSVLHGLPVPIAMLAAGLLPCLMLLGPQRKGLEDWFSRSVVIRTDT